MPRRDIEAWLPVDFSSTVRPRSATSASQSGGTPPSGAAPATFLISQYGDSGPVRRHDVTLGGTTYRPSRLVRISAD